MNRFGSRRSRRRSSFESGAIECDLSSKRRSTPSTQQPVRAWVEQLEIRLLLAADLSVAITGPATTPIGENAFYQVTVTNNGPDDAQVVGMVARPYAKAGSQYVTLSNMPSQTLLSPPPATPGVLPAGSSDTFQVVQSVQQLTIIEGNTPVVFSSYTLLEDVSVQSSTSDPDTTNNFVSFSTEAVTTTTLSAFTTIPSVVVEGQNSVTFTVGVSNWGPNDAQDVALTDLLPPQLQLQSIVQKSGPAFVIASGTPGNSAPITAIGTSLPAGSSATFQLTVVNASLSANMPAINQVLVSGMTANGPAVAKDLQSSIVWKFPTNLAVQLTGDQGVLAGSYIDPTYTVSVSDLGITFPTSATLNYTIPSGFTLVAFDGSSKSLPVVDSTGTVHIPFTWAGTFDFTEAVDNSIPNATPVIHTASITTTPTDDDPSDNSASLTTVVYDGSDVAIAMKPVPTIPVNGVFDYQLTVSSLGPSVASNVSFADILPPTLEFEGITQTSGPAFALSTPATGSNGTVSGQLATMLPGSATFTLAVRVPPGVAAGDSITNTATVSTTTSDPNSRNNTASFASIAQIPADLSLTATGDANPVIGGNTTYVLTVTNNGPADATGIVVVYHLPPQLSFTSVTSSNVAGISSSVDSQNNVTITFPSLAAGASATLQLKCSVGYQTPDGTPLVNTATVSSSTADSDPTNNSAAVNTTATLVADLGLSVALPRRQIQNTSSKTVPVLIANENNTISVTVKNSGPGVGANVQVLVPLPAGATFKSSRSSPNSGVQTIDGVPTAVFEIPYVFSTFPTTINATYFLDQSTAETVVTQRASVSSAGTDPNLSNNSASQTVTVYRDSDLVPTISGPAVATAGTLVDYVFSVSNTGDLLAGQDSVTFNIPTNAPLVSMGSSTFSITPKPAPGTTGPVTLVLYPGLGPGQAATVSFLERIDPSVPDGGTVAPTATLVRLSGFDDPSDNNASFTTNVITQADVSAAMIGPDTITAGGNATYTITLTNNGPSDAQNVTFLDNLPAGMTFVSLAQSSGAPFSFQTPSPGAAGTVSGTGTLPAGASAEFQLVGMLQPSVPAGLNGINNTVNVSATTSDEDPSNNSASVTSNVVTSADLAVSLIEPPSITAGTTPFYRIVVQNKGLSDATSVVIETVLPASETYVSSTTNYFGGTTSVIGSGPSGQTIIFTLPDFPAGASDIIDVASTIRAQAPALPISNNASAISATPDPDPTNNSASVSVPVVTAADLRVSVINESTTPPMLAGDRGKMEVQVSNSGPSYAQDLVVTDTLPVGASLVSITNQSGAATNLPVTGATGTLSWTIPAMAPGVSDDFDLVYQLGPASEVATKSDSATVSSSTSDPNPSNNSATLPMDLQPADVILSGPAVSRAGTLAQYAFVLQSEGWSLLTIEVPQGATISATSGDGLPSDLVGKTGIISFPFFGSEEFVISEATPARTPDGTTLTTSAWVNFDTSTTQSVSTKIIAQADITASITGPSVIIPGTLVSYTLKVTNNGPSDARNVSFNDALPPGMFFRSLDQTSGPWFALYPPVERTGGNASGYIPYFPAGASASFTLTWGVPSDFSAASLSDTLNVATTTTDLNSSNNSASVTTSVHPQADLGVTLSTLGPAVAGTGFTYTISLNNTGPSVAHNVVLSEVLAPGVLFSSFGSTSGVPYTATGPDVGTNGTVTFRIASIPLRETYTYSVNVALPSNTPPGPLPSTATVTSSTPDPNTANNTATDTITQVMTSADVKITDIPPMMFIDYGMPNFPPVLHPVFALKQNNTWVVDVTNSGPSDAQNVTWSSAVPAGVMVESVSQVSGPAFTLATPTGGTGTVSGYITTLSPGQTAEFDLVFAQNGIAAGDTVSDTATVTSDTTDPDKYNNTSTATAQAYTPGDLAVSIQGPSTASAGTYVNYIIDIKNDGQLLASGATLNFDIPAGEQLNLITSSSGFPTLPNLPYGTTGPVSFTLPAGMISGGDANIALQLYIEPDVPDGTILSPTATLTDTPASDDPSNNTAPSNTLVRAQGDLVVTQTGPSTVVPGDTATYTFTIANNGPSYSQNVSFSDPLPAGMTFISLSQTGSIFTLDPHPVGEGGSVTGSIATLRAGALATFTLVAVLDESAVGTSLTNTVSATSDTTDLNATNNAASVISTITPQADLSVSIVSGPTVAGDDVTYTLTVNNSGPSDAQNVVLTQALPDNLSYQSMTRVYGPASVMGLDGNGNVTIDIATLAAVSAASYRVTLSVPPSTPAGLVSTSTLAATSTTTDTNLSNNVVTDTESPVTTSADLSAGIVAPSGGVIPGQNNTFSIEIINHGPSDAQNGSWSSTVPAGMSLISFTQSSGPAFVMTTPTGNGGTISGSIATLAAGQSADFAVVYFANGASLGDSVTNAVSVASDTPDAVPANNNSSATAAVRHAADLAISLDAQPSASADYYAGTNITYRLDVTNFGGAPAGGATITYNIPDNAPFSSFGDSSGFPVLPSVAAGAMGPITFTLPAGMPYGGHADIEINEHILPSVRYGRVLAPTASLSGLPNNDDPSNNTASATMTIHAMADLAITQTGPATVTSGTFANYEVTITNNGPSDASNVTLRETVSPGNVAVVTLVVQDSGPTATLAYSYASMISLPAGASAAFTVPIVPDDEPPGTVLTAIATVSSSDVDLYSANNVALTNSIVEAQRPMIAVPAGVVSSVGPVAIPFPIHRFGRTIHTTLTGFSGVVAQFIDPTPTATALHFHVAINWGDGGLSVGTVSYDKADGRWNVSGSHRYKKKGTYTITVIVQDSAGRQGTITSHAIVGPVLATPLTKQLV